MADFDDEVRIPIKPEVDESDLEALKTEIESTFKKIHDYEKAQGTKKNPYNVKGVSDYEAKVKELGGIMETLQKKFELVSQQDPFSELKQVQEAIGKQLKANAQTEKEISSEHMRSLSYLNQQRKAENEVKRIKEEQRTLQRQYNKEVSAIDPESKGAKSKLRDLQKQYELQTKQLEGEKASAQSMVNINKKLSEDAEERSRVARENYENGNRTISELREQASEIGKITKQEGYVRDFEERRRENLETINKQLRESQDIMAQMLETSEDLWRKDIEETGYKTPREKMVEKKQLADQREQIRQEKELERAKRQAAAADREEATAAKQSASQYYYRLRAMKMLTYTIQQADNALSKFGKNAASFATKALSAYLKLIPGVNTLRKALDKTTTSQRKLNKEVKATTKSHNGFNESMDRGIKNLLKYGFGIRSLFVLFNRLRSAVKDGLGQLAQGYDEVNRSMSSILTSMNQIKAAITTIVEPIIHVLAPVLEKISAIVSKIAYEVASFIAALTGRSTVFKATRLQMDYAESLDKTAKSAREAKKELSGLDKLNVINSDKDNNGNIPTMGFEQVPIDPVMADLADKFKKFLNRLITPIKKAWEKTKAYVINNFKYMLNQLKALGASVARDFWRVWEEEKTQEIFEDMFLILGDMELIIGNLAKRFREAWDYNENGYIILSSIRDIVHEIVHHIRLATLYTAMWADRINFIPVVSAIANLLKDNIVPAVKRILDLCLYLYKGFLELLRDFIENTLPTLIRALGYIIDAIGLIAENIQKALEKDKKGEKILNSIEYIVSIIADAIEGCAKKTKEWAENLDFGPLTDATLRFLDKAKPLIQFIADTLLKLWNDVLLPFWKYLIEKGFPKLLDTLSEISGKIDWEKLTENMNTFMDALGPFFELAWETLVQIISDLGNAFADFVNSDTFTNLINGFKEWVENANPEELAHMIEKLTESFIGMKAVTGLFSKIAPVITGIMTIFNIVKQFEGIKMAKDVGKIAKAIKDLGGASEAAAGSKGIGSLISSLGEGGLLGTIGGIVSVIGGAVAAIAGFVDAWKNGVSPINSAVTVIGATIAGIGLAILGIISWPAVAVAAIIGALAVGIAAIHEHWDEIKAWWTGTVVPAIQNIPNAIVDIFNNLKENISAWWEGVKEWWSTNVIEKIQAIPGKIKEIWDNLPAIFEEIGNKIGEKLGELAGHIYNLGKSIGDWWTQTAWPWLKELPGKIVDTIIDIVARAKTFVTEDIPNFIAGIVSAIGDWWTQKAWPWLEALPGKIGEAIAGIVEKAKKFITEDIPNWIKSVGEAFSSWWTDTAWPWISGLPGKIVEGFKNGLNTLKDSIVGFGKGFFDGFKDGFEKTAKIGSPSKVMETDGENTVKGLVNGIKSEWSKMDVDVTKNISNLVKKFRDNLKPDALTSVGKNMVNGLKSGLTSALNSALSTVTSLCNKITTAARKAFQIHSPSKVFAEIGELLVEGLEVGIDDNMDDVNDSFENLMPSDKTMDNFYDRFMTIAETLTTNISEMFDEMAIHIDDVLNNLGKLSALQNFNSQFANISKIRVPDIAKGYSLPTNVDFKQSSAPAEIDLSDLPNIIKDAVIDAITATATDLQTEDETIMINIDGKNIFQVVKNENTKYKKMHGASAFE